MLATMTVCLVGLLQPSTRPAGDPPAIRAAEAEWIRANAAAFETAEPGRGWNDLHVLGDMVGEARIVALGEPTHGTREAFQMKHRILEYLVEEKGFSIFSIEASFPESFALNRYVIHGKGDPAELIAGMYFWTWRTEEVLAMVQWMREWNQRNPPERGRPRVQFTGFDMQTPDVAGRIAADFLRPRDAALADRAEGVLAQVKALAQRATLGNTGGFASATAAFPAEDAKGKKLEFSAWIRTQNVDGWAGAWWRCDTPDGPSGFNNMHDQGISGTRAWKQYHFTMDVPPTTEGIAFGFLLSGGGTAWFDDVRITLDGQPYDRPDLFSLDFENDEVKFLTGGGGEYSIQRSQDQPHGGRSCLQIRRTAKGPPLDANEVHASARRLVADITARRDDLARGATPKEVDWAIQNALVVAQCAGMHASANGYNARDDAMAENVRWILDQNPGQKIVLWAHNAHVSKGVNALTQSMGSHLARTHGTEMVVVGFAAGRGAYTAFAADGSGLRADNPLADPPVDSVEARLLAADVPLAILDLRRADPENPASAWASARTRMRSIGAMAMASQFFPMVPRECYDVIVWQAETTPARQLP